MAGTTGGKRDIDGGYAWVILAGCFWMYMLTIGTLKSYGVLYANMLQYFDVSAGETSWIGSLCFTLTFGLAPFANALSLRFSFRSVTLTGGLLIGAGYFSSAFVSSVTHMYWTLGIVSGLGYGLTFGPCATVLNFYFDKRRTMANGIVVSASAAGVFGFPYLYTYLIEQLGLRGAFVILGGIMLNICSAACCLRQPASLVAMETYRRKNRTEPQQPTDGETVREDTITQSREESWCSRWSPDLRLFLFKRFEFTAFALSLTLGTFGYIACLVLIPVHILQLGYTNTLANVGVSVFGGCEVVSRLALGAIMDKVSWRPSVILAEIYLVSSIFVFMAPFVPNFSYAVVLAASVGLLRGSCLVFMASICIEAGGKENMSQALGIFSCVGSLGMLLCHLVIGWTYDWTGSYDAALLVTASTMLLSALGFLAPQLKSKMASACSADTSFSGADSTELSDVAVAQGRAGV